MGVRVHTRASLHRQQQLTRGAAWQQENVISPSHHSPGPPTPASPARSRRILGTSLSRWRPEGHGQEGSGKDSLLPDALMWPHRASTSHPFGDTPGSFPPPPSPASNHGQVFLRGRWHRQSISFPIRTLSLSQRRKGGSSHPASRETGKYQWSHHRCLIFSLHISREIWHTMPKYLGEQYLSWWEHSRALGWGNKAFGTCHIHTPRWACCWSHGPPWSLRETDTARTALQPKWILLTSILSQTVHIKNADPSPLIPAWLAGISHDLPRLQDCPRSQADRQRQATSPCSCALSGKPRQSPAAGSPPGITNLPVLRRRLSPLVKLCLGRESSSQRPLHKPTPTTTALLRKMIHWCLKIPQTGALADFMTDFPRRHGGQQSLMLRLASTPREYLSAITTDSRAWSLHIILLFVHKFPLKGFQHPHAASSQASRLLKPSEPDRMVPHNYKQHGTILYYNTCHYYFQKHWQQYAVWKNIHSS